MKRIIIAGAGKNGIKIAKCLRQLGVEVEAFLDNNPEKIGTTVIGIPCFPVDYYEKNKDECRVILSTIKSIEFEEQIHMVYSDVRKADWCGDFFFLDNPGYESFYPLGHYYSLYPDVSEVISGSDYTGISDPMPKMNNIDLNYSTQNIILNKMFDIFNTIPIWKRVGEDDSRGYRFRVGNRLFSDADAVGYYCMLNIVKPKRVIEIGSGWTSALLLDVNEYNFNRMIDCSFIEPYADRLKSILKLDDMIDLQECGLQDIPLSFFDKLESGDILFVDSTHVSKYCSDVNYLFFEILPRIRGGVYIHIHDIFYPLTYPFAWIKRGFVLNEAYLLRAFLEYNNEFEIVFYQNYLEKKEKDSIEEKWPLPYRDDMSGGSFWMRRK